MDISQFESSLRLVRIQHATAREHAAILCAVSEKALGDLKRNQTDLTVDVLMEMKDSPRVSLGELVGAPASTARLAGAVEYFAMLEPCDDPEHPFTYGILVCTATPNGTYLLSIVHNVSTDPVLAMTMAEDFCSYALSPVHLIDAILDRIP